jgi:TolB-like protein/Tfp pilus assembly protein PilF
MCPEIGKRIESQHPVPADLVRSQLDNVLASELFSRSERLSAFLRFVVDETLKGRGETLKEPVLAHQLYGKEANFDGASNPIVRVDARRLRDKLREYYGGRTDPVVISLPKGSYVPAFEFRAGTTPAPNAQRLAAEDESPGFASREPTPAIDLPTSARWRVSGWHSAAVALGMAALFAGVSAALYLATRTAPTAPTGRIMLAVLPFQNLTGDPEQEYLCDGLTEEMIAILGGVDSSRLGIIARTSAMHYKNTTKRADEIGRELGVGYLLETSLRRIGDRARITAQLIEVETQRHVWVEQYERDAQDALVLQREVAATVAQRTIASLGVRLGNLPFGSEHQSDNSLAYEQYLRGRYQWAKGTIDGLHKARAHFQKAIALDPSYARAYSGLADTYALLGSYDIMRIGESHPLGRAAALKAIELDESLGEAHRSLAAIVADYYWDWEEVERHYKRAIALDPNNATTMRFYAYYLAYTGRPVEALPIAEQACRLDPVSPSARMILGITLLTAGRVDAAVHQFEETLDLDSNFSMAHIGLGLAYLRKGMPERAVAEAQKARAEARSHPGIIALHGYTLARAGRRDEALTTLDDLRRLARTEGPSPFLVALVYVGLEDSDRAFQWLEKALEARDWQMPMLKGDAIFDALRSDPRFPALLGRIGLPL